MDLGDISATCVEASLPDQLCSIRVISNRSPPTSRHWNKSSRGTRLSSADRMACCETNVVKPLFARRPMGPDHHFTRIDAQSPEYVSQFWGRYSLFTESLIPTWPVHVDSKAEDTSCTGEIPVWTSRPKCGDEPHDRAQIRADSAPVRPSAQALSLR